MPLALDLTDRRFGRLKALRLEEECAKPGPRRWLCICHPPFGGCGKEVVVSAGNLTSGNTTSCGCARSEKLRLRNSHPAGRLRRKQAWHDIKVRIDDSGEWYSLRGGVRYLEENGLKVSKTTLTLWAGLNKKQPESGCHWLGGERIQYKPFMAVFGRTELYLRRADLDRILSAWRARTAQRTAPEYPGLVYIGALAKEMTLKPKTVRKLYRKWCASRGKRPVVTRRPARSAAAGDGRALPRSYLPEAFAAWLRQRHTLEPDPDDITVREAAELLGQSEWTAYMLIANRHLHPKKDKQTIVCRGGYPRPGLVLSRKEVLEWRQKQRAKEALAAQEPVGLRRLGDSEARAQREKALATLRELLPVRQPQPRNRVVEQAVARGITYRLVYWAKKELKVKTTGGGLLGPGYWTLHAGRDESGSPRPQLSPAGVPTEMAAAESRTVPGDKERPPLPPVPHPVYIVQPADQPVPVNCSRAGACPMATATDPPPARACPRWDDQTAILYWRGVSIREFRKHPAQNQRELVEAFHQADWSHTISDPFRDSRKLNQTIKDLNRTLQPRTIRFLGDGTGEGVM